MILLYIAIHYILAIHYTPSRARAEPRSRCPFLLFRCPNRVFSKKSSEKIISLYQKLVTSPPDPNSNMSRLARFLTGTAVGLVLGGGGAK